MTESPGVVIGVTGSIAAYKTLDLVSRLRKRGIQPVVVMTDSATRLVAPASFEALSGNQVALDLFPQSRPQGIEHISLAKRARVLAVVPATANFMAKAAHGMADDLLSTVALAVRTPRLLAPAMNCDMWADPAVQNNLILLKSQGWQVVGPDSGHLACGDSGAGRLAPLDDIEASIICLLEQKHDLAGASLLVTAGRTEEPWDPVRFLSNRSSGRMGMALAEVAARRGARVTLVSGPADIPPPPVFKNIPISTAEQMRRAVLKELPRNRCLIMAAAVADYAPLRVSTSKIKRGADNISLALKRNPDILKLASLRKKPGTLLVGFALETDHLVDNARRKLAEKKLDLVVANPAQTLASSDIRAVIIDRRGEKTSPGPLSKSGFAELLLDKVAALLKGME